MIKLTPDDSDAAYTVRACCSHEISIHDISYHHTILLSATALYEDSLPNSMPEITRHHIEKIISLNPTLVIIGSGHYYHSLDEQLSCMLLRQGIGLEIMTTKAACRTFNVLMSEKREAVALLLMPG